MRVHRCSVYWYLNSLKIMILELTILQINWQEEKGCVRMKISELDEYIHI